MADPAGRPLRVVHVIGGLELGGAETLLYRLATHGIAGVEQHVICLGKPDWYSSRLEQHGVTVHHLGMSSPLTAFADLGKLRRVLRESGADVVQTWMYVSNMLVALVSHRVPVVWAIHNSSLEHIGLLSRFSVHAGGIAARWCADAVINCSQRSAELHGKLGYSAARNPVIHNGYDALDFHPDPKARVATRRGLGFEDASFVIASIARWHSQKDIPTLLRATRLAADRGVPLQCLLIGSGLDGSNPDLTAAIGESGCEELVHALGRRSDIADLARALDVHILASSGGEAFPNVVAETMLSATPNVVTDVGDSAFMVGDTGWVVPPRDAESLASSIAAAWTERSKEPEEWAKRRDRARARIAENFTFERMAEAYRDVWRDVARPRAAPSATGRVSEPMTP
jgi:glycosyltransferase involved in cell wall biosynthesis